MLISVSGHKVIADIYNLCSTTYLLFLLPSARISFSGLGSLPSGVNQTFIPESYKSPLGSCIFSDCFNFLIIFPNRCGSTQSLPRESLRFQRNSWVPVFIV